MRSNRLILITLALSLALAFGCQRRAAKTEPTNSMNPRFTVAVVPFSAVHEPWQLLAGYMPDHAVPPNQEDMADLDEILHKALHASPERNIIIGSGTKDCLQSVHRSPEANRLASLKYWQEVGKCLDAQFVLVPMVVHWKEREGSAAGSTSPAWVIMDLYLVNVKTGGMVNHFHYDYQQKALTDNILEMDKFFKRRGQWVTAEDLAREGIEKGVKEFGL